MNKSNKELDHLQASQIRDTFRLGYWTAAWLVTMAAVKFGPEFLWQSNDVVSSIVYIINLLVAAGVIVASKQQLRGLDEMQQRIQLEAMGLTLGVGLFVGLSFSNMKATNLIPFEAEILHLTILMSLTYLFGIFIGHRKYL